MSDESFSAPASDEVTSLLERLACAPKVELHLHLEGSIRPATVLELARRNRIDLPARTPTEMRRWFTFENFDRFIEVYIGINRCFRAAEDYTLVVVELARELAEQNVRYAEVTFSPSTHEWLGTPRAAFLPGLAEGRRRARELHGVDLAWVFDIVRNAEPCAALADLTTGLAIDGREAGVVALGLGGKEAGFPPEPFAPFFERARAAGLRSVPHAGETAGPDSVLGALDRLAADRLGHGVRAAEDPALVRRLAESGVPLEVCPTSNLRLGIYASAAEHPLAELERAGVAVTINTDDPALFDTTLNEELARAVREFGLSAQAAVAASRRAIGASFLPAPAVAALLREFDAALGDSQGPQPSPA